MKFCVRSKIDYYRPALFGGSVAVDVLRHRDFILSNDIF